MNVDVSYLNETTKCYLAPSKIHGVGAFALRDLKEGERLYADLAYKVYKIDSKNLEELHPEPKKIILEQWPRIIIDHTFAWPTTRYIAYMNHSDKPNYFGGRDVMLKDVKKGQEITEDYRTISGWQIVFPWLDKKGEAKKILTAIVDKLGLNKS